MSNTPSNAETQELFAVEGLVDGKWVAQWPICDSEEGARANFGMYGKEHLRVARFVREEAQSQFATTQAAQAQAAVAGLGQETCQSCQGNGEIVTNWERYKHPSPGDRGDEAVAECQDCDGRGVVDAAPTTQEAPPQEAQEPVAWQGVHDQTDLYYTKPLQADVRPLYTAPQPAPAPLSDDTERLREALQCIEGASMSMYATRSDMLEHCQDIARAVLAQWGTPQPVVREPELDKFLSDVMTAAGLVTHGKQCKQLGERLGAAVMKLRTHNIPQKGGD